MAVHGAQAAARPWALRASRSVASRRVSTWELLADLPLEIEEIALDGREQKFSEEFSRLTTRVLLRGGGEEGVGEDVVYDGLDQVAFQAEGTKLPVAGSWTLASFSQHLGETDLFQGSPPERGQMSQDFRRWGLESSALDLALRQAGKPLHEVVGREPKPVTFVVSTRLKHFGDEGPGDRRPRDGHARALPQAALQARPDQRLDAGALRRAEGHRRDRLARPQGHLQGHARSTWTPTPSSTGCAPRPSPTPGSRTPSINDETRPVLEPHMGPAHLGRPDPLRGRHRGARAQAAHGEHQALALRPRSRSSATPTTTASARASAPTAAARPSWPRAAARSSTWPRSSTRTRPTTRRPAATT